MGSDSYLEAHSDYYGFPSNPVSIYHTGDPWPRPTGPDAQRVPKEARPIFDHPIAAVWHELGRKVYEYFDSVEIKWTTIDPIRFAEVGKEAGPLFLWVGVMPKTLSRDNAKNVAVHCKRILAESLITDVEIAFRESVFTRSVGPQLLNYAVSIDPTADVRSPFTPALGLRIASLATPHFEGTGGVYLCEGGESERVFVLTARHVVLPPSTRRNELYVRKNKSTPRKEVILLGCKAYQDALQFTLSKLRFQAHSLEIYKTELEVLGEAVKGEDNVQAQTRKKCEDMFKEVENSITIVDKFHSDITERWSVESERVLGHIVHSPPISVGAGPKCFTEDWALIELYRDKINWQSFKGNTIDLRMEIPAETFAEKMYPDPTARTSFKYPSRRLLQLRDVVKEAELRHPTTLDENGDECIIVMKNGMATNVTLGRATGIESFVRVYDDYNVMTTSMEIAIYQLNPKDSAFSAPGDSGSIIADGKGRIVGLLTGGTGQTDSIDVTYATPYYWVEERIKEAFPNARLYPIVA